MASLSMEGFVGNGALGEVLPKLLEEGWNDVPALKLMKSEDMEAINMTQQQKDALEMRSHLHAHDLMQFGDELEASGKCLQELLGLSTDDLLAQFTMKRGHIARFMDIKTNACAADPSLQAPRALTSSRKATETSGNNTIYKATMDPKLYQAAMGGKENEDKDDDVVLMQYSNDQLELQLTSNKKTILHVAAQFGNQKYVTKILEKNPSLLLSLNINDETPLHMAAREGYSEIVQKLIECAKEIEQEELERGGGPAKEILRKTNKDKDTALHMAVRKNHLSVVELLMQEDKEFIHPANNAKETPLYLAAERGYDKVVSVILKNCRSSACGGPGGKTALHVAVMNYRATESTKRLLEWKPELIDKTDENRWTPLHYAALKNNERAAKLLLDIDKSLAYITTNDDRNTAFHVAAADGCVEVMEAFSSKCPDCWEMVNDKGQNVLHIAVAMESRRTVEYILGKPWINHLINQKDIDGNTPLHLLATCELEMPTFWFKLWRHASGDDKARNNENFTPGEVRRDYMRLQIFGGRQIARQDHKYIAKLKRIREENKKKKAPIEERHKARNEEMHKRVETHLIVATLVATITFAAAFTMPGGYDSNEGPKQGMPLLLREAAFKVFVITNTIAVICSTSSVFLYVSASLYSPNDNNSWNKRETRYYMALCLILIAVAAMTLAFITGSYAVLAHSLGISISVCVIGCISFFIYFIELKKLFCYYLFIY